MKDELDEIDNEIQRLKQKMSDYLKFTKVFDEAPEKIEIQINMQFSGSALFDSKLLELKNTHTTTEERSFIYNFFLSDMERTHNTIKDISKRLETIRVAETA